MILVYTFFEISSNKFVYLDISIINARKEFRTDIEIYIKQSVTFKYN